MEELTKEAEAKLQMLLYTNGKTRGIVEKGNIGAVARHRDNLQALVKEVDALKLKVEQTMFKAGKSAEDVGSWSSSIEEPIAEADEEVSRLEKWLVETNGEIEHRKHKDEEERKARAREEELKFEREQMEMKLEFERQLEETKAKQQPVEKVNQTEQRTTKLPKLQITKFNGTYEAWLPFWNKFQAEIDKANLASVTKFAYLKELVDPKVRAEIDGLPFTTEGYDRAKNILIGEYGKTSEIVNAYVQNIANLPVITGTQPAPIHEFYKKLVYNVQSLETLGKLKDVTGNVRSVLDKLKGVKADLVRGQMDWQDWDFPQLIKALKSWKEINPIGSGADNVGKQGAKFRDREKTFHANETTPTQRGCVYCDATDHRAVNCDKFVTVGDRRKQLGLKQLCFNCTGSRHRASECKCRSGCQICSRRHHTSICDKHTSRDQLMTTTSAERKGVVYPMVTVDVNGVKCRALLDTGAGSSYASSTLLNCLHLRPIRQQFKRIEMMFGTSNKAIDIYGLQIRSVDGKFTLEAEVNKVDRNELLTLENPKCAEIVAQFSHLKGVATNDNDEKAMLPVHLILGTNEYAKIKTGARPRVGRSGEPVAEYTKFGWTILSPGTELDLSNMLLTQTSAIDYEELCKLDVLGLKDNPSGDQETVYEEFKEQLTRSSEGWYETNLPWKGNHPPLSNNHTGSLKRLKNLVRKLEIQGELERYNDIIQTQLSQGIVEHADEVVKDGKEFYIPHKAVVRENAESTKIRIVYDASARANVSVPSLNECLEIGPPLQNQLWNVLVRNRFYPVAIAGDLKQAFLQIRVRREDRVALRFHWIKDLASKQVDTLRFTRVLFGLAPSPFLLAAVIKEHLQRYKMVNPELVEEIERSMYVDDLISGGETTERALEIKMTATTIFGEATFKLHKWHSNDRELEVETATVDEESQSYAKQQLGTRKGESKLLGVPWDKEKDEIQVSFPISTAEPTKRGILGKVAKIYDPLGLASPVTLSGKMLYRDACDTKIAWDRPLPSDLQAKTEGKAYLALYACSLTRGLFLEVLPNLATSEFLRSLKRLIARRGRPKKIYSDNGKTFVGAEKWLKQVMRDEKTQDYLAHENIKWQFNLSRAAWWGGQFERLIALVKTALNKTIGCGMLTWTELCEVVLDVEIALNNRPLCYVEDDIQLPVLTPNSLLFLRSNQLPELEPHHLREFDLRRRAKYLRRCKQALWTRWTTEYLRGLRERHRMKHKGQTTPLAKGEVVIIKDEERNRNKWKIGIVEDLISGRDGIVRAAKLRAGKGTLERAVQHLYPLELSCDRENVQAPLQLNPLAPTFRPRRDAAVAARYRIQDANIDAD
ncbi:uncharacterized protein [Pocillopora verrucosa]|uniref:uncharacterized protein n=1 Tax=Pocillopora verrucosa TaxID=203993 RepID=UPI00333FA84A